MDPLIELPEPAKARITAREAEAKNELDKVRRVCESDVANAEKLWGGYFDLFTDNLRQAVDQARASLREGESICAQYVFNVHATEYRAVLPDLKQLESVLEKLREALIKQYGEHVRAGLQVMETHQLDEASGGNTGVPNGTGTQDGAKLLSWKDLRAEFLHYSVEHADLTAIWRWMYPDTVMMAAIACSVAEGIEPPVLLRRMYQNPDVSARPAPPKGQWTLEGGSPGSRHLFRVIAGWASGRFPRPSDADPWRFWLDRMRAEGYAREMPNVAKSGQILGPYPRGFEDQHIEHLFNASADFCLARSLEEQGQTASEPLGAPVRMGDGEKSAETRNERTSDGKSMESEPKTATDPIMLSDKFPLIRIRARAPGENNRRCGEEIGRVQPERHYGILCQPGTVPSEI